MQRGINAIIVNKRGLIDMLRQLDAPVRARRGVRGYERYRVA
jgi:hypothetical protein